MKPHGYTSHEMTLGRSFGLDVSDLLKYILSFIHSFIHCTDDDIVPYFLKENFGTMTLTGRGWEIEKERT